VILLEIRETFVHTRETLVHTWEIFYSYLGYFWLIGWSDVLKPNSGYEIAEIQTWTLGRALVFRIKDITNFTLPAGVLFTPDIRHTFYQH
jgi:hypothetical protein